MAARPLHPPTTSQLTHTTTPRYHPVITEMIQRFFNKPLIIFFMSFSLLLCIICKEINKKTGIPYASLILFVGILLSYVGEDNLIGRSTSAILKMGSEELFYIFIPILIFEQGFNSDLFLYAKKV